MINFEENVLKAQRENVMEKIVAEIMNVLMRELTRNLLYEIC